MRLAWPFHLRRESKTAQRATDRPAGSDAHGARPGRAEWRGLAPLETTIGESPLLAPPSFKADLAGARPPAPILQRLAHERSDAAPRGLVSGLAAVREAPAAGHVGAYRHKPDRGVRAWLQRMTSEASDGDEPEAAPVEAGDSPRSETPTVSRTATIEARDIVQRVSENAQSAQHVASGDSVAARPAALPRVRATPPTRALTTAPHMPPVQRSPNAVAAGSMSAASESVAAERLPVQPRAGHPTSEQPSTASPITTSAPGADRKPTPLVRRVRLGAPIGHQEALSSPLELDSAPSTVEPTITMRGLSAADGPLHATAPVQRRIDTSVVHKFAAASPAASPSPDATTPVAEEPPADDRPEPSPSAVGIPAPTAAPDSPSDPSAVPIDAARIGAAHPSAAVQRRSEVIISRATTAPDRGQSSDSVQPGAVRSVQPTGRQPSRTGSHRSPLSAPLVGQRPSLVSTQRHLNEAAPPSGVSLLSPASVAAASVAGSLPMTMHGQGQHSDADSADAPAGPDLPPARVSGPAVIAQRTSARGAVSPARAAGYQAAYSETSVDGGDHHVQRSPVRVPTPAADPSADHGPAPTGPVDVPPTAQREAAPSGPPAAAAAPSAASPAADSGSTTQLGDRDVELLLDRLYPRLRIQLSRELLVARERLGLLTDLH